MTVIRVPRPRQSAMNPDRPVNALLQVQIQHLREAERNLPLRYHTEIYANAIRTEGEAASYIRAVTDAIHQAHADAAAQRKKRAPRRRPGFAIAAVAEKPARNLRSKAKTKTSRSKRKAK